MKMMISMFSVFLSLILTACCQQRTTTPPSNDLGKSVAILHMDPYQGSSFAVSGNILLTAAHVLPDPIGSKGVAEYCDGRVIIVEGAQLAPGLDVARLSALNGPLTVLSMRHEPVTPGEQVFMSGYAFGLDLITTSGTVQCRTSEGMWMVEGSVYPGMSGGPVQDVDGKVVGVIVSYIPGESRSFFISATAIMDSWMNRQ